MGEFRDEFVTTTTETRPGLPVAPITVNSRGGGESETVQRVTTQSYDPRRLTLYRMQQAIGVIVAFVEGLIAIRFVLRLLGANADAGFAQLIYGVTAPLVAPFLGLFGTPRFEGSAFEFTSLVAMIIYALLGWVIVKLVLMFFGESRRDIVTQRTDTRIQ